MKPSLSVRIGRFMGHDTGFPRFITSLGLLLLGAAMAVGLGTGQPGYTLMEQAWPLKFWGLIYLGVGGWGVYGVVNRLPYWVRIGHTMACMYLWAFIGLAQFADQPLPTRMLLGLPAIVEMWVLVKVVLFGQRKAA